jgi:hypothetical protein
MPSINDVATGSATLNNNLHKFLKYRNDTDSSTGLNN